MTHCHHLPLFKQKENKTHKKKPRKKKEPTFKFQLCPLIFGSRFYPFVSNAFSWHLLLFKQKKRKKKEKKNHRKEKKCKEGRELSFKLPFYPFIFGSRFCPPTVVLLFQTFSPRIFFFSSTKKEKNKIKT